ncbi:DUF7738 domain-containing protein [Arenibacter amylolyticus]|uniref:DUF7738 domain-containing protein n=1 Tax=Arenibacter amylolyticus TaxID=1406873 RepID=UPI000A3999E3|nr:hypothetical protein [Arenibacter amylolyticus]
MGIFDFRDLSKRKKKDIGIVIECDSNTIRINGAELEFPTNYSTLEGILGKPDRIEAVRNSKNKVYLWDNLGIYCSTATPDNMLMVLLVEDNRYGLGHQPLKNFQGKVLIDGEQLSEAIQKVDGDRPYMIRSVIKDQNQVAIALGWNPDFK